MPESQESSPEVASLPEVRVLIVDDNRADVYLIREAIRMQQIHITIDVASDGAEAIGIFDKIVADPDTPCPQVVLLDLNLPRKTGIEVLRHIRQSGRCANVPVIVITTSDAKRDRDEATALGANRYFRKPNTFDEYMKIGSVLRELIEDRQ